MQTRLWLISHASTAAQRSATFADANEPLDTRGLAEANAYANAQRARFAFDGAREVRALTSPAACARDTAQALGLSATVAASLADTDYGEWQRKRVADIVDEAPEALEAWLSDPAAAPPGGESFEAVIARVGAWLDALAKDHPADLTVIAITHAAVLRAALIHVLRAPAAAFTQIEIAPLATIELRYSKRGWTWWPHVAANLQP
ncbi:MAG TPA: histidine phosphatase family protein [Paraburkholderia sp.]